MDPELENMPTDYEGGLDFSIKKTSKGGYADYSTSTWARKETALTQDELAAIEQYGLYNLADFLPKKPSETELKIIKEMFEASVNGEAYDADRWGAYYKPAGLQVAGSAHAESAPAPAATKPAPAIVAEVNVDPPFDGDDEVPATVASPAAKPAATTQRAEDILAMIRSRQK